MPSGFTPGPVRVYAVGRSPDGVPALPLDLERPPAPGLAGVELLVCGDGLQVDPRLAALLDGPGVPGVGERLRAALGASLGAAAALVVVAAELRGGALRVALPAHPAVLTAARELAEALCAPSAPTTAPALPSPPPAAPTAPSPAAGSVPPRPAAPALPGATAAPMSLSGAGAGWHAGLAALGAAVDSGAWCPLPDSLERLPAVRQILERAGERRPVRADAGPAWSAFGFPDLRRPDAKVLLLRDGPAGLEITALHRYPARVGVCGPPGGLLPAASSPPSAAAEGRTPRAPPPGGRLFAVEADAVYIDRDGMIMRWDGRRESPQGSPGQALASLALRWSER